MKDMHDRPAKILVIDDDPIVHFLIGEILAEENYLTEFASSGKIGLEKVRKEKIDLILLDIMIPEMDGFDVCARLQNDPLTSGIPIVFLSAKDDEQSYIRGFDLGAIDYLTKPINHLDLKLRIRNYLKLSWNEAKLRESELRYKSIVEDQTEFIVRMLPDGIITFVNNAFCNFLDQPRENLIGKEIDSVIKTDDEEKILDQLNVLTPREPVNVNVRKILLPEGRFTWQQWVDRCIFDAHGNTAEFQVVGRDVTIQKRYEEAVRVITDETAGVTGSDFFEVLLNNLLRLLNVEFALIGEFIDNDKTRLRTLRICRNDFLEEENRILNISSKWFDKLSSEGHLLNNRNSVPPERFGLEVFNADLKYKASFLLYNSDQLVNGVLMVMSSSAFEMNPTDIDIIKIFSLRTVAEIGRETAQREKREMHLKILNTIIETEEKERRRFAQDLHDGMGPLLSTIKLYTRSVLSAKDSHHKEIAIEKSLETIDEAISCTKEIANNISPNILKDFGLVVAINSYVKKFNDTKKVNINFRSDIDSRYSPNIEASFFRIIIELINNTIKHASANNVLIELNNLNGSLFLNYTDDGIGCDIEKLQGRNSGQGITNIINRTHSIGGEVRFDSALNEGFNVKINFRVEK